MLETHGIVHSLTDAKLRPEQAAVAAVRLAADLRFLG